MRVTFKYDLGQVVYYLWSEFLGGEASVIGQGTIEQLHHDSGRFTCHNVGHDPAPHYNIRRSKTGGISVPERHVFRKWSEARKYVKENGIVTIPRVYREMDVK